MSNRWPAGIIRKTPVTPAGPYQNGAASGVWSLADASYWTKQGLWPIAGNTPKIEDVFQTWLYTGTSAAQTITNGINISGQGGLVWIKERSNGVGLGHYLFDTARGLSFALEAETTSAQANRTTTVNAFNSNGFSMGSGGNVNNGGTLYASWTFRKAPDFFDVVTYTGTGANQNIAHNLGSVPGMILVKRTDSAAGWQVYHRSNANTQYQVLNTTAAVATGTTRWNSTTPTSSVFTVGTDTTVNASGGTYVAYLYAHDTASTGIIQCGTFTTNGSGVANVTLGWEPQWVMIKRSDTTSNWTIYDTMRGMPVSGYGAELYPNTTGAETLGYLIPPTATGFSTNLPASATYIYMAIRRGPMRTPTLGTSVFSPVAQTGGGTVTTNFPVDMAIYGTRSSGTNNHQITDRLRGAPSWVTTNLTNAETQPLGATVALLGINNSNVGYKDNVIGAAATAYWNFRRAPGFMDEVCYAGINATRTVDHSLGVVPELIIVKNRTTGSTGWPVWSTPFSGTNDSMLLNTTATPSGSGLFTTTPPTSTVFTVGNDSWINSSGNNYVAYLFASCPGVSKVGTYTGNGSSQTINCAFTTGARFVLIKRTDSTGGWLVWDSARGIVAGNDPYLALNSNAAEVTTDDSVDTDNTGFIVNQVAASNVNVNGGTYIFLAIA